MSDYDAIIIGAGHNGLVSALYLARAGWKVLVLERNQAIGGAVQSGEITRPGFVHDLWSTNQNLFLASPVYQDFKTELTQQGLNYVRSPNSYCCLFPNGKSIAVTADRTQTYDRLRQHNVADANGWAALYQHSVAFQKALLPLFSRPLPSVEAGLQLGKALFQVGPAELVKLSQMLVSSTADLGKEFFETPETRTLLSTWGMEVDFAPDVPGGAMFPLLESFANLETGIHVTQGGAANMPLAIAHLAQSYGAEIQTGAAVTRIITAGTQAVAVELATGEQVSARRAIIANLTPGVLFGQLLPKISLPAAIRRAIARYTYGPATLMVHLALRGKPNWIDAQAQEFAFVHLPASVDELSQTYQDSLKGILPAHPLLIVSQTSVIDPSRTPTVEDQILWIQVRTLPSTIRGDAMGEIQGTTWDEVGAFYADRVVQILEQYAPGIRGQIRDRVVYTPGDIERQNPNLVGGDTGGGSHHLRQNFMFRPFANFSNYRMPVKNLFMVGAATWPGSGTNATSGYLCTQKLLSSSSSSIFSRKLF
ncbi:MAG: NAD(P)/FAD-dependent oxidoreductase [Oculatellaceae cyanobacterium Prado106]|jgi:phytoene dehydrogenase-like protein|nr:NAD(P)/FAD-dependent oxidoreductase [Oculatellaceae cyanobacterium Prado106]